MQKTKIFNSCLIACCATLLFSAPLMAAGAGSITGATTGTIPDAGSGPGIQVKLSPGVELGYFLIAAGSSFSLKTQNTNVQYDNGTGTPIQTRNEYGIANDYPGYFMRPVTQDALVALTVGDSSDFPTTGTAPWTAQ